MKKLFIIANWKSYKTTFETQDWLEKVQSSKFKVQSPEELEKEIIVCPSYTSLPIFKEFLSKNQLPLKLGVQDVSAFGEGAYTGEINVKQIKEFAEYAIIGHSERRKYFHETDQDVLKKVQILIESEIIPVLCISDMKQLDYYLRESKILIEQASKIIFVYEPPSAISGGGAYHAENPETAEKNAAEISQKIGQKVITLYGGSVNPDNAKTFFAFDHIDGALIGQASLDPEKFVQIIHNS